MEPPPTWLDRLKALAASEKMPLEAIGLEGLEELLTRGLIQKDERPLHASLEDRYEGLQETHRLIVEAKGCADRLQRRMAPKSRLAGLLPLSAPTGPGPDDPDAVNLLDFLEILKIQVRGVAASKDVLPNLDRILDYLQVEGRECLDRLAATDREIDQAQKQAPMGTQVDGAGFFRLTPAGEAALPEAAVIELFEAAIHTVFGPSKGESFAHFKEDPSSLLALLVDRATRGDRPSTVVGEYENLLNALERIPLFADTHPLRAKIAFLVRLLRAAREEPKRAYLWCGRERLSAALQRVGSLLPNTVTITGWRLPYTADLFVVDGGLFGDEDQIEQRFRLFEAVHRIQSNQLQEVRIRDGQYFRLALVLAHAARIRNFAPGILMDRFIRQALEVIFEAAQSAPYDLGDRGTCLLFGTHLAHAAGFMKARIQGPIDAFAAVHARFHHDQSPSRLPVQVMLHIFATLDRLERMGAPISLEEYAGLFERIRKRLRHHKAASRIFSTAQIKAGDEAALAANLCAQVCFRNLTPPPKGQYTPDVGLAGLYEERVPGRPPLLGSPFGTLMLI